MQTLQRRITSVLSVLVLFGFAGFAQAATIPLQAYNAAAAGLDLSVDLMLDAGTVTFTFHNNSTGTAANSSASRIYFEQGLVNIGLSNPLIDNVAGVDFSTAYPGPASPPAGNTIGWSGEFFAIGAVSPPPVNGVNVGDELVVSFTYAGTLADLVNAITDPNGNMRIAAHVQNCVGGDSCSAVSAVPLPAGLPLLMGAMAALGFLRRRKA